MAIDPRTSRATLKSFFKKNAIPKESDFAQLIDSAINQADDGIAKPDGEALSLQPDAKDSGDKKLLNFYKSFADPKPAWTLSLSPAGRPGWSLGDGDRRSKLFIDESNGQVGIGTVTPTSLLNLRKDAPGALGPVLSLNNAGGSAGAGGAIDFSGYDTQGGPATARIQSLDDGNASSHLVFSTKRPGAAANPLVEALRLTSAGLVKVVGNLSLGGSLSLGGNLGLGSRAAEPRSAIDTGSGLISGAANDYQKAQFTLSGGGLVTWDGPNGYLKWTQRFITISAERGSSFASGYVDIFCPTSAAPVTSWDGASRVDPAKGVLLKDWEALYAVHEVGQNNQRTSFQIVVYNSPSGFHAPSNWLLVAVVNSDDRTLKLGSGAIVAAASAHAAEHGSGLPKGAIILWSGAGAPAGWALCDGQAGRPDLRGRFVLGAGTGSGLSARALNDQGGEERHKLTVDEMPSHAHAVSDPGHLHNWTGSRQQAGTDDRNNTQEFSRGDAGAADTVSKDTDRRLTGIAVSAAGGDKAHENMPPFYVLAYIIKL